MSKRLLVIGAHSADFAWRAAGSIALVTSQGDSATVLALSYGERGEAGALWKEPNQTVENVKRIRHEQASEAARIVGAAFRCLDLGDYCHSRRRSGKAGGTIPGLADGYCHDPQPKDPFNPDHPVTCQAVQKARLLASGAGVVSAVERITPPDLYFLESHQPELCEFQPNTLVDITPVMGQKRQAMAVMQAQSCLQTYYAELASRRGNHARRISGMEEVKFAEAMQRTLPLVVKSL